MAAFQKSLETDKLPLGVFYVSRNKPSFEETTGVYREDPRPLYEREVDVEKLRGLMNSFAMNI